MSVLIIAIAGGIGAILRALLDDAVTRHSRASWPVGIFAVNIIGSFILGAFTYFLSTLSTGATAGWSSELITHIALWAPALTTGLLGGFTTFSTAMLDAVKLARSGRKMASLGLLLGNYLSSLAACLLGIGLAYLLCG